jgi:Pyridoxamine 5'-phosphate oxidase
MSRMATWEELEAQAPELAVATKAVLEQHKHKVIATLRRDGSPRVSGNELRFIDGDVWLGMMPGSVKALDLLRDPRVAVHGATVDPELTDGDAKLAGRAIQETDPARITAVLVGADGEGDSDMAAVVFRIDVTEVVLTRIGDPPDHLVVDSWHEGKGTSRVDRY